MKDFKFKEIESISYREYSISHIHCDSNVKKICFPPHWHDKYEIIIIDSGTLFGQCGENFYFAVPGDILVFGPQQLHIGSSGELGCHYRVIQFDIDSILGNSKYEKNLANSLINQFTEIHIKIQDSKAAELFNSVMDACEMNQPSSPIIQRGKLCLFFSYLLDNYMVSNDKSTKLDKKFYLVLQYIENNFTKDLVIEDIAKKFSYEKAYFCRKFHRATGVPPSKYIQLLRIELAQKLIIENSDDNILAVAINCGFNSQSYFSKVFKNLVGKSPLDWKKEFSKE